MLTIAERFQTDRPVAFVTGSGAARVGRVVAEHLARCGCQIVLHALRSVSEAEAFAAQLRRAGTECLVVQGAVEDEGNVRRWIDAIVERFGRIDIAVTSAAIWSPKRLEEVTAKDVSDYLHVNTLGSFLVGQHAGLQMVKQVGGGAIIHIGDWACVRPYPDHAAYFPSKGAIEAMTRSLAVELAERNPRITVNAILPGPVQFAGDVPAATQEAVAQACLTKRSGTPMHVAHAIEFLVENDFVTGVLLPVDGGRSVYANDPLHSRYRTG
jgi:pteridine reductase